MEAIWCRDVRLKERTTLNQMLDVQTVVIGAGMAGLLTAYLLQRKGHKVVVVEAKRVAGGQTKNITAKITSQHGMIYDKLIRKVGMHRAKAYAMANEEAIRAYEQLIREEKINCHFERKPAYLYSVHEEGIEMLRREAKAAKALGINAKFIEGEQITELPFAVSGAVCFENQAQFHPLEFIAHLADEFTIYEDTKVLSVKGHCLYTNHGMINAKNIVFATHYPFINVPGFYFLRQHQERSYVLALEDQKELSGMYYGIDANGISLRSSGNTLLLGGGAHRTGKDGCKAGYSYLREQARCYYPKAKESAAWSAQDCMPHDELPFIGKYSMLRSYWYVATGFKKWGMTTSMIAAISISNQIYGEVDKYGDAFSPQRLLIRASIKKLIVDIGESTKGLTKGLSAGKERRCPHMGCKLEWNEESGRWECPCHGSGFSEDGFLQDNPAQIDLK